MANRYEQAGFILQSVGDTRETAFVRDNADGTLREFVTRHNVVMAPMPEDECVDYGVCTMLGAVVVDEIVLFWGIAPAQVLAETPAYVGCFAAA